MKLHPTLKRVCLVLDLLLLIGLGYLLLCTICISDFHLDFSLRTRILNHLGMLPEEPSQVPLMLHMFWSTAACLLVLIILQFVSEHRRVRNKLTPRWTFCMTILQVCLGLTAAILLALIGLFLDSPGGYSMLPYMLGGLLGIRLIWFGVHAIFTKR